MKKLRQEEPKKLLPKPARYDKYLSLQQPQDDVEILGEMEELQMVFHFRYIWRLQCPATLNI